MGVPLSSKGVLTAFSMKVDKRDHDKCWEWLGAKDYGGYGQVRIWGKQMKAHRASWEFFFGPIPNGLSVLHKCDNPSCVNPYHLFLGDQCDNITDCVIKGRHFRQRRN